MVIRNHNVQRPGLEQFQIYVQKVYEKVEWDVMAITGNVPTK